MGLTERHWFENEDAPENYEWALEDAVYNSCTNKKADTVEVVRCKDCKHRDPEDGKCDSGHGIQWQLPRQDDWFCADAEPKDS